jgi:soluble lytic murein transglycosylase
VTLTALSLDDLAEGYLKALLSDRPSGTELLLALTNLQAEQGQLSDALFNAKRLVPNYFEHQSSELPREMWQWLYPKAFWSVVQRQARLNRLDPYLVMALIRQESAFNPKATSVANARGLMQVLPKTAATGLSRRRRRGVAQRLYDPAYNVRLACRYFREMLDAFNGNVEEALAAYNAGDFRVKDWLSHRSFRDPPEFVESIPFRETRLYVESVMRDEVVYRRLLSGSPTFMKCGQSAN